MRDRTLWGLLLLAGLLALFPSQMGCDDGSSSDGDSDGDSDSDTDGDSDTDSDSDSDEECAPISWGSMLNIGSKPSNWEMEGYADEDGDGVISDAEKVATTFTLEDIHCGGGELLVWLASDKY